MTTDTIAIARGTLLELGEGRLVLGVPHTEYRLHLVPTISHEEITTTPGKRIKGEIIARALKVNRAAGGGGFIEPVWGEPRIVAGKVLAVEADRVLVEAAVPMWVTLGDGQAAGDFAPGQMVNFYVQSGTRFRPIRS